MPSKRQILESLNLHTLRELADTFDLVVFDRRTRRGFVDALAKAKEASLDQVLNCLSRDELKTVCRDLGLGDIGRSKAELVARIVGDSPTPPTGTDRSSSASGLKNARVEAGLTHKQVADALGVTQGAVSAWETGRARPSPQDLRTLNALYQHQEPAEPPEAPAPPEKPRTHDREPDTKTAHRKKKANGGDDRTSCLGFEDRLWDAADILRNNMDPAEYKHVVLGLIFLKYISDAFEERQEALRRALSDPESEYFVEDAQEREEELEALLEDRDEYAAENVFWVPPKARWSNLRGQAKQPTVGKALDEAMDAIEAENPALKGALPKVYALPSLDKHKLGELIDLMSGIGLGTKAHREKDTLGRVYEYFLARFASAEGRGGGEFYTPTSIVRVLVEMLEPYKGRVYDPCCGSGGMFVQSVKFTAAHGGRRDEVTVYGQESNPTTWRMARMNLAIRGIEANLGKQHGDSFHRDLHPDLRADFVLANPPFNISNWGGERLTEDVRWRYGTPPAGNANFAWLQHIVHHLAPGGTAGVVLANGSMSSQQSGEGEIRRKLVEADLVDCMVAMPPQLFYAVQIPVCLWFLTRDKGNGKFRNRRGEVLFIDARKLGRMESRVHRVLDPEDIERISATYHAWRNMGAGYEDVAGFCRSASKDEIATHDFVLTPGRYVGAEDAVADEEAFEAKMQRLVSLLRGQQDEMQRIDATIASALGELGYE